MKKLDRTLWIAAVCSLGMAFVVGCTCGDEHAQKAPAPNKPPAVAPRPPPMKAAVPPKPLVEALEQKVDLPVGYPSDAPIYPGALTNNSANVQGRVRAIFSTPDSQAKVLDWYKNALNDQGWQDVSETQFQQHKIVKATKGGRQIELMISEAAGKTLIMLSSSL